MADRVAMLVNELVYEVDKVLNIPDRGGWFNLSCWNALSLEQQTQLIEEGSLEFGFVPAGECNNGAEVAIEGQHDAAPGPRFYCYPCAAAYLSGKVPATNP
jgi:hypothetical protein